MYKPMYKNIQETSRILQKALDSSHDFHHSIELCGLLQASLEPSTLFPLMANCRSLQKLPRPYINPWGDSFETSYDTRLTQAHLGPLRHTWPIRHHLRPIQALLGTLGPLDTILGPSRFTQTHLSIPCPPWPIMNHLAHTQTPLAHLGLPWPFLGHPSPFRLLKFTQAHLAHLDSLSPPRPT